MASVESFWRIGHNITGHDVEGSLSVGHRKFRAFFGTSPAVCVVAWDLLADVRPNNSKPNHLLWALMLLKRYCIESFNAALLNWDNRYGRARRGTITYISLDGTDFRIMEPSEFSPKWYSHKFHGPGLRYELGLCIRTGEIVWAHGGLPCGAWPDLRLARDAIIHVLDPGERIIADRGYRDQTFFDMPNGSEDDEQKRKILARHQTLVINEEVEEHLKM
ncbi:hypothetical protein OUZ56_018349 [Daphnia magna]|uniref:DDE Tnp4 domain-containing protein n=1 Tax=Daphnia magna TaxID=35525 RepID=A0ABQ9Z8M5_9CRUS|nr:hypothetical protein OUZ56_018349 [Daphnia magna]